MGGIAPFKKLMRRNRDATVRAMLGPSGSIFDPASPEAAAITRLFVISLWICAVIFAVVAGIVGYSLARFRWHEGEADPVQFAGSRRVEIVWTAVPFGIVLLLFGLTVHAMTRSDPPLVGPPDLIVVGHQWWWEIRSPKLGYVTANEMHIPVGRQISVRLDTSDVLHEFWVPQLTRKMTTIPQAGNHVWLEADKPGTYEGVCSEFCGTQHAWMRFEVVAQPEPEFEAWARSQRAPARAASGEAAVGERLFRTMTCVNCHSISGAAPGGNAGPDLTHFASRRRFGSGIVENTEFNLRRWLANPQEVKPGAKMPDFKLTADQIDAFVAYFETLR
jgi:cytochrome c oxidase subunit 2